MRRLRFSLVWWLIALASAPVIAQDPAGAVTSIRNAFVDKSNGVSPSATAQSASCARPPCSAVVSGVAVVSSAPTGEISKVASLMPRSGRVEYTVMRGDGGFVVGRARHEWQLEGNTYAFRSTVETIGIAALFKSIKATQESRGEITASGFRPTEFTQERGKGTEKARFDWKRSTVKNGDEEDALVAGTQDVLSVYYQLAWNAPTRGILEIPIATGRKLDQYRFEVIGTEALSTEDGPQQTTHVRVKAGSDIMDMWLAPKISPLPLRITILNKKGELYDQRAKRAAP